jgi:hypothetical protein
MRRRRELYAFEAAGCGQAAHQDLEAAQVKLNRVEVSRWPANNNRHNGTGLTDKTCKTKIH